MKQIPSDIEANKPMNYGEENLIIHLRQTSIYLHTYAYVYNINNL